MFIFVTLLLTVFCVIGFGIEMVVITTGVRGIRTIQSSKWMGDAQIIIWATICLFLYVPLVILTASFWWRII